MVEKKEQHSHQQAPTGENKTNKFGKDKNPTEQGDTGRSAFGSNESKKAQSTQVIGLNKNSRTDNINTHKNINAHKKTEGNKEHSKLHHHKEHSDEHTEKAEAEHHSHADHNPTPINPAEPHGENHGSSAHKTHGRHGLLSKPVVALMVFASLLLLFNQVQINSISTGLSGLSTLSGHSSTAMLGGKDLGSLNLDELKSTAHTIAAVYNLEGLSSDEVLATMFPTGTPDYGPALEVSYDDPVGSLQKLAKMYRGLQAEVQNSDPEAYQRFIKLASNPYGVSCEYCCGVGPIGADAKGNSRCGCSHNPGVLTVALYLSAYSDYNDGEILREVMRWKTLWFPKNMIGLGTQLAGGDSSALQELPGMVGGC